MMYVMKVLETLELKVKKPMIVEFDNKGAVDLAEQGTTLVKWIRMHLNEADIFTKNVDS